MTTDCFQDASTTPKLPTPSPSRSSNSPAPPFKQEPRDSPVIATNNTVIAVPRVDHRAVFRNMRDSIRKIERAKAQRELREQQLAQAKVDESVAAAECEASEAAVERSLAVHLYGNSVEYPFNADGLT